MIPWLLACADAPPRSAPPSAATAAAARVPLPAYGGGLARVGPRIVAADPDGARLVVIDPLSDAVAGEIALEAADAPGRIARDEDGAGYVVLRGSGAVAAFTADPPALRWRTEVCAAPRGIAFDPDAGVVHVACASGDLVTLGTDGRVLEVTRLEPDLADVTVADGFVWATTFRGAVVLRRSADGTVDRLEVADRDFGAGPLRASVAWDLVPDPAGGVAILHQWRSIEEVPVGLADTGLLGGDGAYTGDAAACGGIVIGGVSTVRADDTLGSRLAFGGAPLAVDLERGDGLWLVAVAGTPGIGVRGLEGASAGAAVCAGGFSLVMGGVDEHTVAVLWDEGRTWTLGRQPFVVAVDQRRVSSTDAAPDPAFALFHRDAGGGIACASCHPEAGDDGQVWSFAGLGERRTQPLRAALGRTAPYHWDGEFAGLGDLMDEVFVGRMGGEPVGATDVARLVSWLDALPVPRGAEPADPALADEGARVFGEARCAGCHAPPHYTDALTHDVGTGGAFQTPSLLGVSSRPPYLHDGCASTLRDRFALPCGGSAHGDVLGLSDAEIDAVVAFLETL